MKIHLVDGTYELFRAHFGAPPTPPPDGTASGAVRRLVPPLLMLPREPAVPPVPSTAAVTNAVLHALAGTGVRHIDAPLTPERVWRAVGRGKVSGG